MQDAFHAALQRDVTDAIERASEHLADGMANSFEDYKRRIGYIQGLKDALEIAEGIHKKLYGNPLKGAA